MAKQKKRADIEFNNSADEPDAWMTPGGDVFRFSTMGDSALVKLLNAIGSGKVECHPARMEKLAAASRQAGLPVVPSDADLEFHRMLAGAVNSDGSVDDAGLKIFADWASEHRDAWMVEHMVYAARWMALFGRYPAKVRRDTEELDDGDNTLLFDLDHEESVAWCWTKENHSPPKPRRSREDDEDDEEEEEDYEAEAEYDEDDDEEDYKPSKRKREKTSRAALPSRTPKDTAEVLAIRACVLPDVVFGLLRQEHDHAMHRYFTARYRQLHDQDYTIPYPELPHTYQTFAFAVSALGSALEKLRVLVPPLTD